MEPVLVLVAPAAVDLSPLTQRLWAERIAHRVIEQEGQQCLYLADAGHAPQVKQWLEEWQAGQISPLPPEAVEPKIWHGLLQLLATPFSTFILLLLPAVFAWMHFSADWQNWLSSGAELWPEQRFNLATYWQLGFWDLWRPTLLHFSVLHLLFNSLWWWILARRIEQQEGWLPLLVLLLACGLIGNVVQWWYAGPAFGGISGVTLGLLGWVGFRQRRRNIDYQIPRMLLPVMVGWLLLTISADTFVPGLSGTAHGAHLGGLICGFILAIVWPVKAVVRDTEF
ncbi:MAG: hypothetical protein COB09_12195 [Thalassobium sp.]|nr:MAG: hypothetical protein COB09_12195 [Thalassobium sp.]